MHIAYLINRYPAVSHTFVRREIEALEMLGATVERFSLRPMGEEELPDENDRREALRTCALLERGVSGLVGPVLSVALRLPEAFVRAEGLTVRTGFRSERGLLRNQAYLAEACRLSEELKQRGIRHVHAHFGTNSAAVAMLAHELSGVSYSFTVHGPEEFDKADLIALRSKIMRASFVVAVSSFGRSQLYRHCDAHSWSKIQLVRCGLDDEYLARPTTPVPDVARFVCVGRLCEQKGQLLLVQAAARLRRAGVRFELVLVGDGPMRAELESLIAREQLGAEVRITGWASGQRVQAEIEAARALVLPSFAEGLPVVLMEALARGRPVITTYIAGIPELVQDRECGWLIPAGSVEALAKAMEDVLRTPTARLTAMGRAGQARVHRMHDARNNARSLWRLFEQALSTHSEPDERPSAIRGRDAAWPEGPNDGALDVEGTARAENDVGVVRRLHTLHVYR